MRSQIKLSLNLRNPNNRDPKKVYGLIKDGSKEITVLLKETNKILKIAAMHPDWVAYMNFTNNLG